MKTFTVSTRLTAARAILATGIASLLLPLSAPALTYYWDTNPGTAIPGNDVTEGGAGLWDNAAANFTTSATDSSSVSHVIWNNASAGTGKDTIIFGGTAGGAVTLNTFASGGQITTSTTAAVNNLTFDTNGYILAGTNQIRFVNNGAVGGAITVAPGIIATINNAIQGTTSGGLNSTTTGADGAVDTLVDINGGGTLRMGGGNGSIGFAIATGTTVEQTGGGFSGFNLNTVNGTLRTTANNVIPTPASLQDTAGLSTSLFDISGTTQTISTVGGTLAVTNSTSTNSVTLGLTLTSNNLTHTGVISNGTGKIGIAVTGTLAQGNGFNSSLGMATQTFAGSNTYTGSTSLGRSTVLLDFSNAAAPAANILYNTGFGTPVGDDGKLVITRPVASVTVANSAVGTLANFTVIGKANTTNSQTFSGLKLDTNGAASVLLSPNTTANTVTLDFGASVERTAGGIINFATGGTAAAIPTASISGQNTLTFATSDAAKYAVGMGIAGTGIPANASVTAVNYVTGVVTISANTTAIVATTATGTGSVTTTLSQNAIVATTAGTAGATLTDANGVAFATLGGRDWAAKNAGNTGLTSATYTSATGTSFTPGANITVGTAAVNGTNDTRLSANTAVTTLRYANTASRTGVNLGGNTLTTGGLLVPTTMNDYAGYLGGGTLTSPGADVVLVHYNSASNRQFAVDAVVANGAFGATGFTKGGTGISLLTENNTFTGALTAQQGGLIVTGTNAAGSVNINGSSANNTTAAQLPAHVTTGNFLQIGYGGTAGTIGSGVVNIGAQGLLAVKTSDNFTLGNSILGLGGVTQGGSGTTTMLSAATALYTYAGETTVTAGTLKLDYAASNTGIINDQSKLVLGGGTVEFASAATTTHNEVVRETGTISGASTITKSGVGTGRLRLNSFNDLGNAGATVNFTAAGIADTDTANSNGILGTRARLTVGGTDWAMSASSAADTAITAFTAYTTLAAASSTNTANFLMNTGAVTLTTAAALANTVKFDSTAAAGAQTLTLGTTLQLSQGGILAVGANDITITGGTLSSLTGTNSDLIIHQYNTSANGLTIASVIATGNGTTTLTKSGPGSLTLSAANTYTGQSYLNGGTTIVAANAALGAPASGQTVNLNGGTLRTTADLILSNGAVGTNNRNVVLNGVGGTLEVDATKTLTIGGSVSGPGGLTKTGLGTLDLRSAFQTGPTTVTAGTLKYGGTNGGNGYSNLTIGAAGTVDIGGFNNIIGTLAGSGIVTNSGAATATLTIGALPFDTVFSGTISNGTSAVAIDKTGAGILTLSGANTYTGSTVVSGGTLFLTGPAGFSDTTGFNLGSATAVADLANITAASETVGSLAGAAGSVLNLGGKGLVAGGDNSTTTFAGSITGAGASLTKTAATAGTGTLTLTGVSSYTGATTVDQGTLRIRGSVLVNTDGPLGNGASAIILGTATSTVGGAFATNILLNVQPFGDGDVLTFARPIDFSQAQNNASSNDRNRLRFESNATGGADTSRLIVSGDLTFGNHSSEIYVDRAGQTVDFTGNINGTGTGTVYFTGINSAAPTVDGAGGGTFHFSNVNRAFSQNMQLTVGRVVIDGIVGVVGTNSPIGKGTLNFSDGNGGNTLNVRGRDAIRSIYLETAGSSFARFSGLGGGSTATPTAGAQQTLYGIGATNLMNGEQFGGLNTVGTVTFSGGIGGQNVNVSVTGTAGGAGGTNPISVVHNVALIAPTGGTASFTGAITGATAPTLGATGTPGANAQGNNTRITVNQFRNHPNLDEDRDGVADPGLANALVGSPTGGTVVLTGVNTYGGGTEILGGTLNVNADTALGAAAAPLAISNNAILQAAGLFTTAARTLTLGTGGGTIDTNGNTVTFDVGSTITGSETLTKTGAGKLVISGTQTYATLTTSLGRTDLASALGTGTSTLNANAETNLSIDQILAALNIGAGAVVTLGAPLPPSLEPAPAPGFGAEADFAGAAISAPVGAASVPEPGSAALLFSALLPLLGLRRRG